MSDDAQAPAVTNETISAAELARFIHNYDRFLAQYIASNLLHHFDLTPKSDLAKAAYVVLPTEGVSDLLCRLRDFMSMNRLEGSHKFWVEIGEALDRRPPAELAAHGQPQAPAPTKARPIDEYHEDMGPVLWWKFPIEEPPYVGTPNDVGRTISVIVTGTRENGGYATGESYQVGGWPGYHTHFTPIPIPAEPK